MSIYVPEIKEEVSENAKMLVVEEDGKVYQADMPKVEVPEMPKIIDTVVVKREVDNNYAMSCNFTHEEIKEKIVNKEFFYAVLMETGIVDNDTKQHLTYLNVNSWNSYDNNIYLYDNHSVQITIEEDNSISYYSD